MTSGDGVAGARTLAAVAREALRALSVQIRLWRQKHGMTQADLAARSGISVSFISMIERGERSPSYDTLAQLAQALEISMAELFRAEAEPARDDGFYRRLVEFACDAQLSRRQVEQLVAVGRALFELPAKAGPAAEVHLPDERRCMVQGCERPLLARGLCPSHYRRKLRQRRAGVRRA